VSCDQRSTSVTEICTLRFKLRFANHLTFLEFLAGLRGTSSVTFEEGTWVAWLYDLLKPHVANTFVVRKEKILAQSFAAQITPKR